MFRVALLVVCGCGRLGFDARIVDEPDAVTDGAADARGTCGASTQAPDPITIDGRAFEFTSFTNDRAVVEGVTVDALVGDSVIATATSNADGNYTLSIPTGGTAPRLKLRYTKGGYFRSTVFLDAPLDHDLRRGDQVLLDASDGPVWSIGSMGSVYGSANTTIDNTRGTININVIDCAEQPLPGVAVALNTTPEVVTYLGPDGLPSAGTSTMAPFTFVVAFNAPPALTTVTATAPGKTFPIASYPVPAGDEVTLVRVRPTD